MCVRVYVRVLGKEGTYSEEAKISRWVFGAFHHTSIKIPSLPSVFVFLVRFYLQSVLLL